MICSAGGRTRVTEADLAARQPTLYRILKRGFEQNCLPQAMLLYGSPRCDFRSIVRYIAESGGCQSGTFACGKCDACRRFESGVHPDYREVDGGDGGVKKEAINDLRDFFSLSAVEAEVKHRFYSIVDCQNMTEVAANALLKFLEEPSKGITALLTCPSIEGVLPTIVSRCQTIKIEPLPRKEIFDSLAQDFGPESAYFLSDISGDMNRLVALGGDADFQQAVDMANDFIFAFDRSRVEASFALLSAAQSSPSPKCYNFFLGDVSRFLGDTLAQDGLFGPYASSIGHIGREEADLVARMELSLRESISMSKANLSFTGVLAMLAEMLVS